MRVVPPPISGSAGDSRASAAKRLVNWSSGPNTTDGRMMVADGSAASTAFSPLALVRAYCEDERSLAPMAETCTMLRAGCCRGLRDRFGAPHLHGVESLRAAFGENADQVDRDMGVAHRSLDGGGIAHIGLHGVDLADPAERLQMPGEFRPAHRDADAIVALGRARGPRFARESPIRRTP